MHVLRFETLRTTQKEDRLKRYRFGKEWFPAEEDLAYKWRHESDLRDFKGIQVLTFIDRPPVESDPDFREAKNPSPMPRWAWQGVCFLSTE